MALNPKQQRFVREYLIDSDVRPSDTVDDLGDGALRDAIARRDVALLGASGAHRSDDGHVGIGDFRVWMACAAGVSLSPALRGVSPFQHHVPVVLKVPSREQVGRVDAEPDVARVTYTWWSEPVCEDEGDPVCEERAIRAIDDAVEAAIAGLVYSPCPEPTAFRSSVDERPEPFRGYLVFRHG